MPTKPAEAALDADRSPARALFGWAWFGAAVYVVVHLVHTAYRIRLKAIEEFGPVIHEFDPYFNYRATEVGDVIVPQNLSSCFRYPPNMLTTLLVFDQ